MTLDIQIHNHINDNDDFPFQARIGHGGIVTVGGDPTSDDPFVVVSSEGYPACPEVTLALHGGNYTYQQGTPALVYRYARDRSTPAEFWAEKVRDLMGCICPCCDAPVVRGECGGSGEGICADIAEVMDAEEPSSAGRGKLRLFERAHACHLQLVSCVDLVGFESR
jgi:hypothetical protein